MPVSRVSCAYPGPRESVHIKLLSQRGRAPTQQHHLLPTARERDPSEAHAAVVKELVKDMFGRELLSKHTRNYLIPHHPRAARFYLLPKIHKPGNPSHPIVSSNGAPTENISAFIDYHLELRPLVTNIPPISGTQQTS